MGRRLNINYNYERNNYFYKEGVRLMIQEIIDKFNKIITIKNISQGSAAEQVKISRPHLNKILNGKETPSIALLMRMENFIKEKENENV